MAMCLVYTAAKAKCFMLYPAAGTLPRAQRRRRRPLWVAAVAVQRLILCASVTQTLPEQPPLATTLRRETNP